jgi:hypothetical protein
MESLMTISGFSPGVALAAFGLVVTASALTTAGCTPDNHVGRPCEVGTMPPGGSSGQIVTLSAPALECPSRMCLLPGGDATAQGTGALCTAGCDSDADCEDAETGLKNDPSDRRCENGFACMWPTAVGAFACQKLCVCRDFVGEPVGGFKKPAACP